MSTEPSRRLCLVSRITGLAGPASFQRRLASGLRARGIDVCYSLDDHPYDAILLTGGTRELAKLASAHRAHIPVIQRLDGMNWIHRQRRTGVRHFLRAEINNFLMRLVRRRWADAIVYQSAFVQRWWDEAAGPAEAPARVVHNGVPLDEFSPQDRPSPQRPRLLVFEANLAGGYEVGLDHAIALYNALSARRPVEMAVAGDVSPTLRAQADARVVSPIAWLGVIPPEHVPDVHRSADVLFSADIHPACPNAVIESMASGTPVVAFETGALPELIQEDAGRLVPYGGDPWRLSPPDTPALAGAAEAVLSDPDRFRRGARRRAEAAFGLDQMVDGYLHTLGWISG